MQARCRRPRGTWTSWVGPCNGVMDRSFGRHDARRAGPKGKDAPTEEAEVRERKWAVLRRKRQQPRTWQDAWYERRLMVGVLHGEMLSAIGFCFYIWCL